MSSSSTSPRQSVIEQFRRNYDFELDDFQLKSCAALEAGQCVLVAAPTGSGKTVVGEFATFLGRTRQQRVFYTTPIKALSNQKFRDLRDMFGVEAVGLLTGDAVINGDAPIVVMTTEVLRNMIYQESGALANLGYVVMDEVHYLADRQRGAVWEEVILQLPRRVLIIALSATVSNAEEFGAWLEAVRGETMIIVEEGRPVPLHQHVVTRRALYDLYSPTSQGDAGVNPSLIRLSREATQERRPRQRGRHRQGSGFVRRSSVVDQLSAQGLLPAIVFIFSRKGCDAATEQLLADGVRLTTARERAEIGRIIDERCAGLTRAERRVLRFDNWRVTAIAGIAAHHAGMLPIFKEVVEELFCAGLLKVVYATETLALGINMPARTVVIERLVKWDGTEHVDLGPADYTQLTGRAGRRGIDHEGHAVTVWRDDLDPRALAGLASTRTYPLRSSFRPTYNMAVNLIDRLGFARSMSLLEQSFAQFQADASVAGVASQIRKHEEALAGYSEAMTCDLGDFIEYAAIRNELSVLERRQHRERSKSRQESVAQGLRRLKVGDVIGIPGGRRLQPAVVVVGASSEGDARPQVLTLDRRVKRISAAEMTTAIDVVERLRVPPQFNMRSANARRVLARELAAQTAGIKFQRKQRVRDEDDADEPQIAQLRARLREHPCHACPDRETHARWGQRYHRLAKETEGLKRKIATANKSLVRQFRAVCEILTDLKYLTRVGDDYQVNRPDGEILAGVYSERDLVVGECLRRDLWLGLAAPELAAAVSALVFENRDDDAESPDPALGTDLLAVFDQQRSIASDVQHLEREHRVEITSLPDSGFADFAYRWCQGDDLADVLLGAELAPGDFVRWCRQLVDLLSQIEKVSPSPTLSATAHEAIANIRRGIVDVSATDELEEFSGAPR